MGGLGDVPGDRLPFAVKVSREEDQFGRLGRRLDCPDLLVAVSRDLVGRFEVVFDVHAELTFAGVFGQVTDVAIGRQDLVAGPQVSFDRARLCR